MRPSRKKIQRHQAPQPYTRMNLRSFRNVSLVSAETSSSSDDSCDSFGSDGFSNTKKSLKQAKVTAAFKAPAEHSSLSEFEENNFNEEMEAMKVDSDSDSTGPQRRGQRSRTLKVALKFPTKRGGEEKALETKPHAQPKESDSHSDEDENFMDKRALNIKENKAMLAKLMAELNKVPGLLPGRMSLQSGNTPRRVPRQPKQASGPCRRNPERTSRPYTRSRSLMDGPPSPTPEEDPEDRFSLVRRSRYYEEEDEPQQPRRRNYNGALTIPHVVRPVDEVTQEELNNICFSVRDKVYNRATGTTCHQCRQKTIDTKTNCRNAECVGVRGQFCGPCLRNRYGEEVRDALLNPEWCCPPCRGICNCSFCRAREGRCATGVLVYLAKYHGYDNVHAYLKSLKREMEEEEKQ
ncbi:cell division cycle-associated protein 7a isoform X1 [Scleropages formosus]|uniref:Cell division cycle associated 7a n=2 Tax=Scleropages formosus TaxID=113540 RepID=A0A8C9QXF1_SCLFO|nr:cell division cycle-associated protein 7 isoform X1 [Scleropages formosus]